MAVYVFLSLGLSDRHGVSRSDPARRVVFSADQLAPRVVRRLAVMAVPQFVRALKGAWRMAVTSFAKIQEEFMNRVRRIVWCTVATVNRQGRLRSHILMTWWRACNQKYGAPRADLACMRPG